MNLRDALLCIDCEAIHSFADRCPRCGCRQATALGGAFDRENANDTQVADPVELLRAWRATRPRRARELDTVVCALALSFAAALAIA